MIHQLLHCCISLQTRSHPLIGMNNGKLLLNQNSLLQMCFSTELILASSDPEEKFILYADVSVTLNNCGLVLYTIFYVIFM